MKWKSDLIEDVRSNTTADDLCGGIDHFLNLWPDAKDEESVINTYSGQEVTECNREALKQQFLKVKNNCKAILEIGIGRNGKDSFATVFFENKNNDTKYVGVDIEDRSWLVDCGENIFTIQGNSSNYDEIVEIIKDKFEIEKFDFIFIDGLHSLNQVLKDWEYTNLLSDTGIVGLHDTSHHIGPFLFIRNLDKNKWDVIENACPQDYGIGFATKRLNIEVV
jgi:cephalosporin hydroxylase